MSRPSPDTFRRLMLVVMVMCGDTKMQDVLHKYPTYDELLSAVRSHIPTCPGTIVW